LFDKRILFITVGRNGALFATPPIDAQGEIEPQHVFAAYFKSSPSHQKTNWLDQWQLVGVSPRKVDDVPPYEGGLIPTYGLKNVGRNAPHLRTPPIDTQSEIETQPALET